MANCGQPRGLPAEWRRRPVPAQHVGEQGGCIPALPSVLMQTSPCAARLRPSLWTVMRKMPQSTGTCSWQGVALRSRSIRAGITHALGHLPIPACFFLMSSIILAILLSGPKCLFAATRHCCRRRPLPRKISGCTPAQVFDRLRGLEAHLHPQRAKWGDGRPPVLGVSRKDATEAQFCVAIPAIDLRPLPGPGSISVECPPVVVQHTVFFPCRLLRSTLRGSQIATSPTTLPIAGEFVRPFNIFSSATFNTELLAK